MICGHNIITKNDGIIIYIDIVNIIALYCINII